MEHMSRLPRMRQPRSLPPFISCPKQNCYFPLCRELGQRSSAIRRCRAPCQAAVPRTPEPSWASAQLESSGSTSVENSRLLERCRRADTVKGREMATF